MAERKKITEFGLAMVNKNSRILDQDQLNLLETWGLSPHIYMILTRSRSMILVDSFNTSTTHFFCEIKIAQKDGEKTIKANVPHQFGTADFRLESKYPHTHFQLIDDDNEEVIFEANVGWLLQYIDDGKNELQLKVLYVGQSYGKSGNRNAGDRLISHETLQKIYFDISKSEPTMEVLLYVSEFSCELVSTKFDKRVSNRITGTQMDFDDGLDKELVVNLVEATLIRYFQPKYNEKLKNTFPSKEHSSYAEAYRLDFNKLRVEVGSPYERFCLLFSEAVKVRQHHICEYHFHGLDERKCMFDFSL